MDILLTILIIVGGLLIAPFVAFGLACITSGIIIGLLFFIAVSVIGIEMSGGVLLTCVIAGTILSTIAILPGKSNTKHGGDGE